MQSRNNSGSNGPQRHYSSGSRHQKRKGNQSQQNRPTNEELEVAETLANMPHGRKPSRSKPCAIGSFPGSQNLNQRFHDKEKSDAAQILLTMKNRASFTAWGAPGSMQDPATRDGLSKSKIVPVLPPAASSAGRPSQPRSSVDELKAKAQCEPRSRDERLRSLKCKKCSRQVQTREALYAHQRECTVELRCQKCNFKAASKLFLARHQKSHSLKSCPHCRFKTESTKTLWNHVARNHNPQVTRRICHQSYSRESSLATHVRDKHPSKWVPYAPSQCRSLIS